MQFVIYCRDKAGAADVRLANREKHLGYLNDTELKVILAGPLLSEDGEAMIGSLLVVDAPDRNAVDVFTANDPYTLAGLFESVALIPFRKVLPATS